MTLPTLDVARMAGRLLAAVAERRPLVQNITNYVSMDIAANALLAIGASPAMVHAPEETPEFSLLIDALVLNIGTLSKQSADSMEIAATAAQLNRKKWLLDPVGAGGLTFRNETVARLLKRNPAIIRGNAAEIISVTRMLGLTVNTLAPRGVDSTSSTSEAEADAALLARHCGCTVVATGEVDIVTDGKRTLRVANGVAMMARVTAMGCALSSVTGAFLAVAEDPFDAAAAALAIFGIAGEMAIEQAAGPASFRTAFIDTLHLIRAHDIETRLRLA